MPIVSVSKSSVPTRTKLRCNITSVAGGLNRVVVRTLSGHIEIPHAGRSLANLCCYLFRTQAMTSMSALSPEPRKTLASRRASGIVRGIRSCRPRPGQLQLAGWGPTLAWSRGPPWRPCSSPSFRSAGAWGLAPSTWTLANATPASELRCHGRLVKEVGRASMVEPGARLCRLKSISDGCPACRRKVTPGTPKTTLLTRSCCAGVQMSVPMSMRSTWATVKASRRRDLKVAAAMRPCAVQQNAVESPTWGIPNSSPKVGATCGTWARVGGCADVAHVVKHQ